MSKDLLSSYAAGLLTGGLFLLIYSFGIGVLFLFLAVLPLFLLGLSNRPHNLAVAFLTASTSIMLFDGLAFALFFILFWGIPAWYVIRQSVLRHVPVSGQAPPLAPIWFPIGNIIIGLTIYGCCLMALFTLYYSFEPVNLPTVLSNNVHAFFAGQEEEFGDFITMMADQISFFVMPMGIWLWCFIFYGIGCWSERKLIQRNVNLRPDYAVRVFFIPGWVLELLAICGLASLIGSESISFLGKACVLSLMLPYCFLGAALLHNASKNWPNRRLFLFAIYFIIFSQLWLALIMAGAGLWYQIKLLRKVSR